jgi:hypothetical protein
VAAAVSARILSMARKRRNDAKLEAFAAELASGKSAVEAAKAVGYDGSSLGSNAKKRAQRPDVRARVAELRLANALNTAFTLERLTVNAEEARLGAMSTEEWSAANACIQTIAKLCGLWRDKVALTDPSGMNAGTVRFVIETVAPQQEDELPPGKTGGVRG